MVAFETKKALLEYLGKSGDDRKLVDRLIAKGKVYKEDGMYILVERGNLLDEVLRLREENERLKNFSGGNQVVENTTSNTSNEELAEAKAQWEYYEGLYNEVYEDREYRLQKAFNWIKQRVKGVNWEEFKEWVMGDDE